MHPDDREVWQATLHAHIVRREPYELEFRARNRNGHWRWQRAIERSQWAEAAAVALRWKSASRTVGAIALAPRLHSIERVCRDGGGAAAGGMADELRTDLEAVARWLARETVS